MTFSVRPFADEFAGIAPLISLQTPEPVTPAQVQEMFARFPAEGRRHRLVAATADGGIVGYASAASFPGDRPGRFWLSVIVAPAYRRQGAGTALWGELERWLTAAGARELMLSVPDDADDAVGFATCCGFRIDAHKLRNLLTVPTFDETPFLPLLDAVRQSGIRFLGYGDEPEPVMQRKLYALYKETDMDSPGYAGTDPANYPPFEHWQEELFDGDATLRDGIIIAADGDRLVGVTILQHEGNQGGLYTEYTGVLREYRGRNLGLALKVLSVRVAKAHGAPWLSTRNDATNGPMLAINEKLGYVKDSGRYILVREM
jgi:GNAT superfamily N-acetyltransferase